MEVKLSIRFINSILSVDISHIFFSVIKQGMMITGFVMVMMLLIEYLNVRTKGFWIKPFKGKYSQVLFAVLLGIIPGCLGTYTVVSLYTHNLLGFGALVAGMIATMGDEAFVLFAVSPGSGFIVMSVLSIVAIVFGILIVSFYKKKISKKIAFNKFEIHHPEQAECGCLSFKGVMQMYKNISFSRALLAFGLLVFIFMIISGVDFHAHNHSHDNHTHVHGNYIQITIMLLSVFALFVIATVPEHFLQEHLWSHIIKKHFIKIFLWTVIALTVIEVFMVYVNPQEIISQNMYLVLLLSLLIGLIPISGPHLFFITMYMSGIIPLAVLIANSIVQDGHGALPLFAESKKSFFIMKMINFAVGGIVGVGMLYFMNI